MICQRGLETLKISWKNSRFTKSFLPNKNWFNWNYHYFMLSADSMEESNDLFAKLSVVAKVK